VRRKTLSTELVRRALDLYTEDGWTLQRCLTVNPDNPARALADCDPDKRKIRLYPKLIGRGDDPLARSLVHELVAHLLLRLSGSDADEQEALWWERTVWRNLPVEWKDRLRRMAEGDEEGA
jgi:hypothetical protein